MAFSYSMSETSGVAKMAYSDISNYLLSLPTTKSVKNVEDDLHYQKIDVDLLLTHLDGKIIPIEIKGDRWYKTGNYFFETTSNKSKATPGCFLYTEAKFIYYYFINEKELHILPMPETKNWFIKNINRFNERETTTPVGGDFYTTVGRLVPRKNVKDEVEGVQVISLKI